MLRIRKAALTGAVAALSVGLSAGPAVAHDLGHNGFSGHHGRFHHALTGTVQSVNTSANTAVITFGGDRWQGHVRAFCHPGSGTTSTSTSQRVTLDLAGAAIYSAQAMKQDWSSSTGTPTTITLADVHPGDVVTAKLAADHSAVRHDVASGTPVPVAKLVDWGAPRASTQAGGSSAQHRHRNRRQRAL